MSEDAPRSKSESKASATIAGEVRRIPTWNRRLLAIAIVIALLGVAGQMYGRFASPEPAPAPVAVETAPDAPPGARTFLPDGARTAEDADGPAEPAEQQWTDRIPAWATAVGASFVVGFLIGWVFRAFVKTMIILVLLGGGALFALSYFNVLNVDLTVARAEYETAIAWLSDQGAMLKDLALANLPMTIPGAVGAVLGLRRR